MGDGLFVHGGVTDAKEARLALAGLLALQGAGMDVRTGVLHGPGTTTLVTGTAATAPMQVAIAVHDGVSSRGVANGPYLMPTETVQLVDIGAAPASGTRVDVVYERQKDATAGVPTPDGTYGPEYAVLAGTVGAGKPDLATGGPVGALELATVAVSAGAVRTTDGTVTITNTARQTVARGAPVPVRNQTERTALTAGGAGYLGLTVKRLDVAYGPMESYDPASDKWQRYVLDDDTGWVTVTTAAGFGNNAVGLQVRRIGKRVTCRYGWNNTGQALGTVANVATIPVGFRPSDGFYGWAGTSNVANTGRVVVGADGAVQLTPGGGAVSAYFRMDNCSWLND